MELIGYARVSTIEQETRMQLDALHAAGVRTIFAEKTSGVGPRPELRRALAKLPKGGTLVVYKLDRMARSLRDLLDLLDDLRRRGCGFRSLTEPIDTSSPIGEFITQILGAVAQLERAIIRERCEAGRQAARARGVRFGRLPLVDRDSARAAADLYAAGFTVGEVAALYGVSEVAIRRALRDVGVAFRGREGAVQRGPLALVRGSDAREAAAMYRDGYSIDQAARAFGVSPSAMRRALVREGVAFRVRA